MLYDVWASDVERYEETFKSALLYERGGEYNKNFLLDLLRKTLGIELG
jgi:hypothetical protein